MSDEDQGAAGSAPAAAAVVVQVLLLGGLPVVPVVIPPEVRRSGDQERTITATTNLSYWLPSNLGSEDTVSASEWDSFNYFSFIQNGFFSYLEKLNY